MKAISRVTWDISTDTWEKRPPRRVPREQTATKQQKMEELLHPGYFVTNWLEEYNFLEDKLWKYKPVVNAEDCCEWLCPLRLLRCAGQMPPQREGRDVWKYPGSTIPFICWTTAEQRQSAWYRTLGLHARLNCRKLPIFDCVWPTKKAIHMLHPTRRQTISDCLRMPNVHDLIETSQNSARWMKSLPCSYGETEADGFTK